MKTLFLLSGVILFSHCLAHANHDEELSKLHAQLKEVMGEISAINDKIKQKQEAIFQLNERTSTLCQNVEIREQLEAASKEFNALVARRDSKDLRTLFAFIKKNITENFFFVFLLQAFMESFLIVDSIEQLEECFKNRAEILYRISEIKGE